MEEWKEYKLRDIDLEVIDGDRGKNYPHQNEFLESGFCLFLSAKNVTKSGFSFIENQYISQEKDSLLNNGKLKRGDIVITTRGTVGNVAIFSDKIPYNNIRINSGMLIIRCGKTINNFYLYHVLRSELFYNQILSIQSGSAQPQLPKSHFLNMMINLPPLPTQQKIAAILSSLDDKIELNNKINTNLEQQAQALFKNWFVDDDSELIETEIGKMDIVITDYVANGSFKDLADNVKYLSSETDNVLIRLTDYNNNFSSDMVYISDESYKFLEKSKLFGDEIIISNVGANVGTVFRCPRLDKKMSLAPNSIMIRGGIYEHYLYLYFTLSYGQGLLKSIVTGSAQPKFNKTNFRSLKIKIPKEEKLNKFNSIYDSLYEKIINNQKENLHLASLRNTLLPKLMNGEIEV